MTGAASPSSTPGVDVPDHRGRTGLDRTGLDLTGNPDVRVIDVELLAAGWHVLRRTTIEYRGADGVWSRQQRETYDRGNGATVLLYNRELRNNPTLQGQIVVRLTIEPDGSVSMCVLASSDMNAPDLAAQVVDRVKTINFGAKDVQAVTIVYPIDFLPAA